MSLGSSVQWAALRDSIDTETKQISPYNITVDPDMGIAIGRVIYATQWNNIVSTAQSAARYCSCHCNYCTCQCNYCTCNCNYCTCDCKYCTCDCNYCTCNCNHACTCNCKY